MKKEKRRTRRSLIGIVLTLALLVTMLPPSGGQKAKAADGYPVIYEVKQDSAGNDYISITDMASNYEDFIEEGTLTFPGEIDGKPVKELEEGAMLDVSQAKKVVLPASIDTALEYAGIYLGTTNIVEELHVMCPGLFTIQGDFGFVMYDEPVTMDLYFYPSDFVGNVAGGLLPSEFFFGDSTKLKLHVSSQTVLNKCSEDVTAKEWIADGLLTIVKDLEVSGDVAIAAKRQSLAQKITQGEAMMKEEGLGYTNGILADLQTAIDEGKKLVESNDEAALDVAIAALDAAIGTLVSLEPIRKAIAETSSLSEEQYKASSWKKLQDAIAAAWAVPKNATAAEITALAKKVKDAKLYLQKKSAGKLEIAWEGLDSGPVVPPVKIVKKDNDVRPEYWYYQDEACTTPAVGQDAATKPTQPGVYYLRGTAASDANYTAATSNVLRFTITERQVNWNGYQWDEATGRLTITEDMPDFPDALEVPWYNDMDKITSVTVKEGVTLTKISAYAFQGAGSLQTFQIPDTVKTVGESAFEDCVKLEGTIALTGVTVGKNAFDSCAKLQGSVALADTMTEVPEGSFGWSGITSVTIPEGITAIGKNAFCVSGIIGQIALPSTVTDIGENSFAYTAITAIQLQEGLEAIGDKAFYYCKSLEDVNLPVSLKAIGSSAFCDCSSIKSMNLPAGLQTIGNAAFRSCTSIESIDLPASLQTIGNAAFAGTGLRKIIIPATVQAIGGGQFQGCKDLSYVEILGKEYGTDTLPSVKNMAGSEGYDTMFDQTHPDIAVLCDGATYDTLASYAGTAVLHDGSIGGWSASILRKAEEYLAGIQVAYQAQKEALAGLQRADYTEATWNKLQEAIAAAEALLVQGGSNQEIIAGNQAAQKKLTEGAAICLQEILDGAKAFLAGENIEKDYDTESDEWWAFQDAVEDAERTLQDSNASVDQIIKRLQGIQETREKLLPRNPQPGTEDKPGTKPENKPSASPSAKPSAKPGAKPSAKPSAEPGNKPNVKPSAKPKEQAQAPKIKKSAIKKVKSTKKKTIQVQWKKLSGVTGYQVQTALNKKFKKGKKTYTIKKAKTTKKTIKKLKRKKKYYVRVRAYKTVKGKKYYGQWSKTKTVKVK